MVDHKDIKRSLKRLEGLKRTSEETRIKGLPTKKVNGDKTDAKKRKGKKSS